MQTGDNCEVQQSAKTCNLSVFLCGRFVRECKDSDAGTAGTRQKLIAAISNYPSPTPSDDMRPIQHFQSP